MPYLDADGKRQVCTEYTVLKSNTANSILDLENKWYELPAGWYVVEGDVIITPCARRSAFRVFSRSAG